MSDLQSKNAENSANKLKLRLNKEQLEAVKYISGPVLVLAGAGSGKTGVITNKVSYLIRDCGYKAHNVVSLTFTNKAAREMKDRISKILSRKESRGLWVSTFHTLGLRILKEDANYIGLSSKFSIFDSKDCFEILKDISKQDDSELRQLQSEVSNHKNNPTEKVDPEISQITKIYNDHLLALNSVDFDDLIVLCLKIFEKYPEILAKWQKRIRYLLLDEYQDTNQSQYQLIKYLSGISGHFTAVGDDDQSIYSWRGADANNLKLLSEDFPNLNVIKLEQNYRCDHRVLSASNKLISNNSHIFEKKLWSKIDNGEAVCVNAYENENEEAQMLVMDIISQSNKTGAKFSDFVVLYRSNYQSRLLEKQFRHNNIPCVINGHTSFFEHTEIRDLMAYLRLIANPDDNQALVRIINTPKREIGTKTLQELSRYSKVRQIPMLSACLEIGLSEHLKDKSRQKLEEFATWLMSLNRKSEEGEKPSEILNWVILDTEYSDYILGNYNSKQAERRLNLLNDLRDFVQKVEEKDDINNLSELMQRMMLLDMLTQKNDEKESLDAVTLMTLHAAKGLEFPFVYIVGLEEGLLPHTNCLDEDSMIEEERRLFYVGMTRAKKKLSISFCKRRRVAGQIVETNKSRFIDELPREEIQWEGIYEKELTKEEQKKEKDALFADLFAMVKD